MTQATVHTRSEALELVAINLARFGHEAPQTLTAIDAGFRKLLGQIEQLCAARAQELGKERARLERVVTGIRRSLHRELPWPRKN